MMSRPGFADRDRLKHWADSLNSQSEFPRLIRRLILETTPGVVSLGMPAGEGVASGGWDGTVRATGSNAWVPAGLSVWELSVGSSPGAKADSDYAKRLATPDGSPTTDCTYVQAILRPWTNRGDWARDRTAEGRWAEVKAHGLDDVDTWLETAPVTWAWLSEQLGLHPYGMKSAESWWEAWGSRTAPAVAADLVLAGREQQYKSLVAILGGGGQVVTIAGPGVDETRAFIAATATKVAAEGDARALARMVFVDELTTWRSLIENPNPLILIPMNTELASEVPRGSIHLVLVPVPTNAPRADFQLTPIGANEATQALLVAGVDEHRAETLGRLARRSLTALRRALAVQPALHVPSWAEAPVTRVMRAAMIAGSWSERSAGDTAALADLAGVDYETARDNLSAMASVEDPPVVRVGDSWYINSPEDAWLLLATSVTEEDLRRLESVVDRVLLEVDPATDLPAEERWMAAVYGKVPSHSSDLRRGLSKSLALLALHGSSLRTTTGTGSDWAAYLTRKVFKAANGDSSGGTWATVAGLLPTLAEASPDDFIDAVRDGTAGGPPVLLTIFQDDVDTSMFSFHSPHTGLLWALERLAWSSQHFGASIDLLARLDQLDPGGRLSNRPFASLCRIFCPWHPENSVSVDRQLEAIDGLRDRYPECAWRLMIALLPSMRGTHLPTNEPEFRGWKQERTGVTRGEYLSFVEALVKKLLIDAGDTGPRWRDLAKQMTNLPPTDRTAVADRLCEVAGRLADPDKQLIWDDLRVVINRHREFADAQWALPSSAVDELDQLAALLAPTDAAARDEWLFAEHSPTLGDIRRRDDHAEYERRLAQLRSDAVARVEADGALAGVIDLAHTSSVPWSIGYALATAVGERYVAELLPLLQSGEDSDRELAANYFGHLFQEHGWEWLQALLDAHPELEPGQTARLLLVTRDYPAAWEEATRRGGEIVGQFWRHFGTFGLGRDFDHVETVFEGLMHVGRNAIALDFLNMYASSSSLSEPEAASLVVKGLHGLLAADSDEEIKALQLYDFESLFAMLHRAIDFVGQDEVARLEWTFLPALGHEPNARALYGRMAKDPAFFAEVLLSVFPGESDRDREVDDDRRRRAENAYLLLSSWTEPPGMSDGRIDEDAFKAWLSQVIDLLGDTGSIEIGLEYVGHVLVSAGSDDDGGWPPLAVRNLFEALQLEHLEIGFGVEVANRRGVTTRGLEDGGGQELTLVEKYESDAERFTDRWPRTARILRQIAKGYESEAQHNEDRAERFRQGLR